MSKGSGKLHIKTLKTNIKNIYFQEGKKMLFSTIYIATMAVIGTKITEEVSHRI